jgi:hypothetical protein
MGEVSAVGRNLAGDYVPLVTAYYGFWIQANEPVTNYNVKIINPSIFNSLVFLWLAQEFKKY